MRDLVVDDGGKLAGSVVDGSNKSVPGIHVVATPTTGSWSFGQHGVLLH